MKKILLTLLFFITIGLLPSKTAALECIAANDFGLGGFIYVLANPNDEGGDKLLKSDPLKFPKGVQIAPWVETNLYTTGISADGANGSKLQRAILKMYVDGRWYPFGRNKPGAILGLTDEEKEKLKNVYNQADGNNCSLDTELKKCELDPCSPPFDDQANRSICLPDDGQRLDLGGFERTNVPCCSDMGVGLYGLIALERGGESKSPNDSKNPEISGKPPSADFRTFHVHPLQKDENGYFFSLDLTKQCFLDGNDEKVCLSDLNQESNGVVMKGKLYFKVNDTYYSDNVGFYTINVVSGVYTKMGFIERTVSVFEAQTKLVSQGMFKLISQDVKFISIVQALILVYMIGFGLMFSLGMVQANQSDLVVRLLKLGIIATLISENSFEFFNTYLFELFSNMGKEISQIIYDSTLFYQDENVSPKFILPEQSSPLSIYDVLINMLKSRSLHMKILGLLFTKYCWYIPFIYVAIGFVFLGIIRSVVVYITAIVLVAMLLITGPIFIVMILFKETQDFFNGWLKLLLAGAMMLIVVAASLAITVTLFMNQIENLFSYSVCYKFIYRVITDSIEILGEKPFSWFDIYWWYPNDFFELSNNVNAKNFFAFLFIGVMFNKVMQNIPQLIDTLANNNLQPFSRFAGGAETAFKGSVVMSGINYARALPAYALKDNYVARKVAQSGLGQRVAGSKLGKAVSGISKAGSGLKRGADLVSSAPDYIDQSTKSGPLISQQKGWKDTLKETAIESAGEAKKSYDSATDKDNKWYRVDK